MHQFISRLPRPWVVSLGLALALVVLPVALVLAQAPAPNPLAPVSAGGNPIFAPVPGADITANGPAAAIHGDPGRGRVLFARNCVTCHNDRGIGGVANPGSDDGTVPPLNPNDPGFLEQAGGDPATYASVIDLFVQHGSRPAGESPELSMIGWGDHKLLSQQDLADIEAYVMQLNGLYWPDRWAPPAEVRVDASRNGDVVTYALTLVNHGSSLLGDLTLQDTLPDGLTYLDSGFPALGRNPGQIAGTTVTWINTDGVPRGHTLGPFLIRAQVSGSKVPANVAQIFFSWQSADGTKYKSSAVSDPAIPGQPSTAPPPFSLTPTTAAAAPPPAARASVKIVQLAADALSWGYQPASLTVKVGDSVNWTNVGSLQHTVTADNGSFDSGLLNTGQNWTMTFKTAGTFNYHCTPHPWMKATVTVAGS